LRKNKKTGDNEMEFTTEVKDAFQTRITTLKNLLDIISQEINEITCGNAIEFIAPLATVIVIEENVKCMREDLRSWQDEDVDETEFP